MPSGLEKIICLNTYDISTNRGPIKAVHSSQLNHGLADLTGAHIDLSYVHEKLSAEDDAHEEDYVVDNILQHGLKAGSRNPEDIEFLVWQGKILPSPQIRQMGTSRELSHCLQQILEELLQISWSSCKLTKHLLAS